MVGVSTHVLRSWERRLSLDLNHRTRSNQRRYWIEDIHRFMAIRQLHERGGLPLSESAARAGEMTESPSESHQIDAGALDSFWAGLIYALRDIVLVMDGAGRVTAVNEAARATLNVRIGAPLMRLAPLGWRSAYGSISRHRPRNERTVVAMRGRAGTIFVDARIEPIGTRPDGPMVFVGVPIGTHAASQRTVAGAAALDG
jgi:DNA-binding transcriptional MerR regulator